MLKKYVLLALVTLLKVSHTLFAVEDVPPQQNINLMQNEIKHVVIVMFENRSFDNMLAWLYGKDDVPLHFIPAKNALPFQGLAEDSLEQYTNALVDSSGNVVYTCPPIKGVPSVAATKLLNSPKFNPNEEFDHVTEQIYGNNDGKEPTMKGFLQNYAELWDEDDWEFQKSDICAIMETYTDKELPLMYGLAKKYAVSDLWFSSVPTQTNPNRAFTFCGCSDGEVINGQYAKNYFQAPTLWNRLSEQSPDTSWKIFWQVDMIPGVFSGPLSGTNSFARLEDIPNLDEHFELIDRFHELARNGQLPDVCFVEPQWTFSVNLTPTDEEIAMLLLQNQDRIFGVQGTDLHPPGDVRPSEDFIANLYTSLSSNQEAWKHTLLILTFDEHGGIFDHVPPPSAIGPNDQCQNGFAFDRFGVRVPAIFISPKINKSTVVRSQDPKTPFDHTSLISTIFKWKNINKANWNMGKRVEAAPTFDSVITLTEARQDNIVAPDSVTLPEVIEDKVIHVGDRFYLRNKKGESFTFLKSPKFSVNPLVDPAEKRHLITPKACDWMFARLGPKSQQVPLKFIGGAGNITHGSFVILQSTEERLGDNSFLKIEDSYDCIFTKNTHEPALWWTIKSVDHPYVGSVIQSGDRVYLEHLVYFDLVQYVPARLAQEDGFLNEFLTVKPITDKDSTKHYWIIEKTANK